MLRTYIGSVRYRPSLSTISLSTTGYDPAYGVWRTDYLGIVLLQHWGKGNESAMLTMNPRHTCGAYTVLHPKLMIEVKYILLLPELDNGWVWMVSGVALISVESFVYYIDYENMYGITVCTVLYVDPGHLSFLRRAIKCRLSLRVSTP